MFMLGVHEISASHKCTELLLLVYMMWKWTENWHLICMRPESVSGENKISGEVWETGKKKPKNYKE